MSFALEYRKKKLANRTNGANVPREAHDRFTRRGNREREDAAVVTTGRNVVAALLLAGLILAVFNSGALVQYAGGLSDKAFGPTLITVSERWHGLMERGRLTAFTDRIRDGVTTVRGSSWDDIARRLGLDDQRRVGDAAGEPLPLNGDVSSIPGRYGDQPAKPIRRTSTDQSS